MARRRCRGWYWICATTPAAFSMARSRWPTCSSTAAIVAGALQDHRRAVVIGTQTFGKGSVQTVLPLQRDRALKLTTARYYTPAGRSIQAEGIVPDVRVENAKLTARDERGTRED